MLKKVFYFLTLLFSIISCSSNNKKENSELNALDTASVNMRSVEELTNVTQPAWTDVNTWIERAKNKVEVLAVDREKAKDALFKTQVTTASPMGSIVYETGGLLIDDGWIRILGSGSAKMTRSLPYWNLGKSFERFGEIPPYWYVADDVIGGFFVINGGGLGEDHGKIYYLSPDNLEFEPLDMTYTDFLHFCFDGDLNGFYRGFRWKNWRQDVSQLSGDESINFYPFLWTEEGKNINRSTREVVQSSDQYKYIMSLRNSVAQDNESEITE